MAENAERPVGELIEATEENIVKRSLKLAVPVAAAYLVVFLGLVAEFVIVGRELGGSGIAAVGLAGTFSLVLVLSFHALEIAAQSIIARRFGERNLRAAGACLDNGLFLAFVIGTPLTVLLYFLGPWIFKTAESQLVTDMAIEYFRFRLPGIPFLIAILVMIGFFNAISRPEIPAYLYVLVLTVNAALCWGLVGGRMGLPRLGIAGAGLAQTLSVVMGFGIFMLRLSQPGIRRRFALFHFRKHINRRIITALMKLAGPVFVQQFLGNLGMFLFILINSKVPDGGISLSAATIARQIGYLTYLPSLGFGIAAATLVSQHLGAGKPELASRGALACWSLGAAFMAIVGIGFILFRDPLVWLFLHSSEPASGGIRTGADDLARVAETARMVLLIVGLYQVLESVNTIIGKALQGAGATLFVMTVAVSSQWIVFIPLAWLLAIHFELGAYGSIYAFSMQLSIAALAFLFKFRGGSWKSRVI